MHPFPLVLRGLCDHLDDHQRKYFHVIDMKDLNALQGVALQRYNSVITFHRSLHHIEKMRASAKRIDQLMARHKEYKQMLRQYIALALVDFIPIAVLVDMIHMFLFVR
jgi:hypothetical protein